LFDLSSKYKYLLPRTKFIKIVSSDYFADEQYFYNFTLVFDDKHKSYQLQREIFDKKLNTIKYNVDNIPVEEQITSFAILKKTNFNTLILALKLNRTRWNIFNLKTD